jgi:hypothetical protein
MPTASRNADVAKAMKLPNLKSFHTGDEQDLNCNSKKAKVIFGKLLTAGNRN